jgi:hypothetical protein
MTHQFGSRFLFDPLRAAVNDALRAQWRQAMGVQRCDRANW